MKASPRAKTWIMPRYGRRISFRICFHSSPQNSSTRAMPSNWRSIHKNDLARAMVAQPELAFLVIAQGNAPKEPTVKILEYKDMEPFFVKGESDEP
jgi:hypothetical protein